MRPIVTSTKKQLPFGNLKTFLQPVAMGSFSNWIKLLTKHHNISFKYLPKILFISTVSLLTAPLRLYHKLHYGPLIENTNIRYAPVFILGHWRSGTTHLHNLMTRDPRLGFISSLQAIAPGLYYTVSDPLKNFLRLNTPETRLIDKMAWSIDSPQEEEMALANLSPYSMYHQWAFPQAARTFFNQSVLFRDATPDELENWKRNYLFILKEATMNVKGKRLVIKNPANTGRVRVLLELFPNARFIHIHRNPYDVLLSTRNLYNKVLEVTKLQEIQQDEIDALIMEFYQEIHKQYLEDVHLIPPRNLIEISYAELDQRPLETLKKIYQELRLGSFFRARTHFERYLKSLEGYKKNSYHISSKDIRKVNHHWGFAIKQWGYTHKNETSLSR